MITIGPIYIDVSFKRGINLWFCIERVLAVGFYIEFIKSREEGE